MLLESVQPSGKLGRGDFNWACVPPLHSYRCYGVHESTRKKKVEENGILKEECKQSCEMLNNERQAQPTGSTAQKASLAKVKTLDSWFICHTCLSQAHSSHFSE